MWQYAVMAVILGVVGYWILHPLLKPKGIESLSLQGKEEREMALQQRKEEMYGAIKEMEFDFEMGKISEEDYQELRSQYKVRALEIMKELDTRDEGDDIDREIEREVEQLRGKEGPEGERDDGKETDWEINFCPKCGRKVTPDNNFCHGCGVRLVPPGGDG